MHITNPEGIRLMSEQTPAKPQKIFNDPISVAKRAKQKVYHAAQADKSAMLEQIITKNEGSALVLVKSKRGADTLSAALNAQGITAAAVHSNKSTLSCEAAAKAFEKGELRVLIATDTMMQSLGLKGLSLVISYDLPIEPEHYLSRVGCMGETAEAIALVSPEEESLLFLIERTMRHEIPKEELEGFVPCVEDHNNETPAGTRSKKKKPRHSKVKEKKAEKKSRDKKPQ